MDTIYQIKLKINGKVVNFIKQKQLYYPVSKFKTNKLGC